MATLPDGTLLPGKLFIVEGIDGSGKSTQLDLLHKWLVSEGHLVVFTEWNSSPLVRRTTQRGKREQLLTPLTFSLIHAADLADRMERQVIPALKAGAIVLADRYIYTAFARDVSRGVNPEWVRKIYSFAPIPTVALYFRVPLEESLRRIISGRPSLKFYEAGMDLGFSEDALESYRIFQARIQREYEQLVTEYGLVVVDATLPIVNQQDIVRAIIRPYLETALRAESNAWRNVLSTQHLSGHYLEGVGNGREEQ
jgi:dTMP kinase